MAARRIRRDGLHGGGTEMKLTRPRKARILEKAGLRYVAGWLPAVRAAAVQTDIELSQEYVNLALSNVEETP